MDILAGFRNTGRETADQPPPQDNDAGYHGEQESTTMLATMESESVVGAADLAPAVVSLCCLSLARKASKSGVSTGSGCMFGRPG